MTTKERETVNVTNHLQTMLCMCDSLIQASLETAADEFEVSSYAAAMAFRIKDALEYTVISRGEIPTTEVEEYTEFLDQCKQVIDGV